MILEDYLRRNAELYPQKTAVICAGERCSYAELNRRVDEKMNMLNYEKSHIVCLRAECSIDFLVTYFALHRYGTVAAPLQRDIPEESFNEIAKQLGSHRCSKDIADVLYTTGTTGHSKGVMISHQTILADAENLIDGQGFTHDTVFVINGPLNHIGSLSKVYPVILLGGTIILVDGLKDMNRFFAAFDYPSNKMATFLVPASIRILIQLSSQKIAALADKIDFVETGAAAISQSDMQTLCRLLPHSRLYNTYASTETGIISTYNFNVKKCLAGCLGKPLKHSKIIFTEQGLIACKGKTLMSGYVGDPERTASVLKKGVIYTSDLGNLDEEGMLHLTGREDDVINVGGYKVAPTEVENAALSFSDIEDCICIPVDHIITGKALKLLVVMKDGKTLDRRALALFLKSKLEPYKIPMLYSQIEKVERTFNGKIDRRYYIDGLRGEAKKISLPRDLVVWEE